MAKLEIDKKYIDESIQNAVEDIKKNYIPVEVLQEIRQEIEKKQTYKIFLDSPDLYIDRDSTLEFLDEYIKEYTGS